MNNFVRRTLTGVWIVIFTLGGFWIHPLSFFLTGLIIQAGTQYEYLQIIKTTGTKPQIFNGMICGGSAYIIATLIAAGILRTGFFLLLILPVAIILITELYRRKEKPFDSLAHTLFSVLYTAAPLSMFPFAAFSRSGLSSLLPHGDFTFSPGIIIGFFILLWINDTGAYLTGITLGRHRLLERISPKKSWEGFLGGSVTALAIAWLLSKWLDVTPTGNWFIISIIISVAGTFGDLVESMLKRSSGVKDSGAVMPGHGGFLDRFDSTLLSFPFVFLFISFFG